MANTDGLRERPLSTGDVDAAMALCAEAGWNQTAEDWRFMLGHGHGTGGDEQDTSIGIAGHGPQHERDGQADHGQDPGHQVEAGRASALQREDAAAGRAFGLGRQPFRHRLRGILGRGHRLVRGCGVVFVRLPVGGGAAHLGRSALDPARGLSATTLRVAGLRVAGLCATSRRGRTAGGRSATRRPGCSIP